MAVGLVFVLIATFCAVSAGPVAAASTFVVNRTGDSADLNAGNGKCDVSSTSGLQCTLRAAIQEANALSGADTINFSFTTLPAIIIPASPLPSITDRITIDGYSQSGATVNTQATSDNAFVRIVLRGTNAGGNAIGLDLRSSNSVIRGLAVQSFSKSGIRVAGFNNVVRGNFVGTTASGQAALGNATGIDVIGTNSTIGGTDAAARNILSGNRDAGLTIEGGSATGTLVQGNFIGINSAGTAALANGVGINNLNAPSTTVGGTAAGAGNVISGNDGAGVLIDGPDGADNSSVIQGNLIGTNATGTGPIPNGGNGIQLAANAVTVGGSSAAARNVISGNQLDGVLIFAGSGPALERNVIQGNFIGTNAAGTGALGNVLSGITVFGGEATRIGGSAAGTGNVISGNGTDGIVLFGSSVGSHTTVQGNKIGSKPDGTIGNIGNGLNGISIQGPDSNTIGGTGGAGNVIAQSNLDGIHIVDSVNNVISGNLITRQGGQGVDAESGPNTITGNVFVGDDEGVRVEPGATGIRLISNQILNSGGLGINLIGGSEANGGVTSNDTDDPDTGANNLQNFPIITSAIRHTSNGVTVVAGTLNSRPNRMYRVELYLASSDPSGHGEAQVFVGAQNIDTNSAGDATFSIASAQLAPGQLLTTTATAVSAGDTSEFSANALVVSQTP